MLNLSESHPISVFGQRDTPTFSIPVHRARTSFPKILSLGTDLSTVLNLSTIVFSMLKMTDGPWNSHYGLDCTKRTAGQQLIYINLHASLRTELHRTEPLLNYAKLRHILTKHYHTVLFTDIKMDDR